jgi:hypothetical protein
MCSLKLSVHCAVSAPLYIQYNVHMLASALGSTLFGPLCDEDKEEPLRFSLSVSYTWQGPQ